MKKIIATIAVLLALGGIARAERTITFKDVDFAMSRTWLISKPIEVDRGTYTETYHAPLIFTAIAKATSLTGEEIIRSTTIVVGPLSLTPYTLKEKINSDALWDSLGGKMNAAFIHLGQQIINVDISE